MANLSCCVRSKVPHFVRPLVNNLCEELLSEEGRAQILFTRLKAQIYVRIFFLWGLLLKGEGFGGVDLIGHSLGGVSKL